MVVGAVRAAALRLAASVAATRIGTASTMVRVIRRFMAVPPGFALGATVRGARAPVVGSRVGPPSSAGRNRDAAPCASGSTRLVVQVDALALFAAYGCEDAAKSL